MIYYCADLHAFHSNIIRFNKAENLFSTVEDMNSTIIKNWNQKINNDDTVFIIGDECWLKPTDERYEHFFAQLKGQKQLIRGNHSPSQFPPHVRKHFCDIKDYKEIVDYVDGVAYHVVLCHYPIICFKNDFKPDWVMIHGHTHYYTNEAIYMREQIKEIKKKYVQYPDNRGQIFNVGICCPWMDYTPKSLKELIIMNDKGMILQ